MLRVVSRFICQTVGVFYGIIVSFVSTLKQHRSLPSSGWHTNANNSFRDSAKWHVKQTKSVDAKFRCDEFG